MTRDCAGAKTLGGSLRPTRCSLLQRKGVARREPIDTLWRRWSGRFVVRVAKRVRGGRAKSWPRLPRADPGRGKPMGASSGRGAKHVCGRQGLRQGSKPRNRGLSGRPNASASGTTAGETVSGCFRPETRRIPCGRRKLRRVNPRSAAGVKQNRRGIEGRKPSRG
jgi:hypothetical protein